METQRTSELKFKFPESIKEINGHEFLRIEFTVNRFNSISVINIYGSAIVKYQRNSKIEKYKNFVLELPINANHIDNSGDIILYVDIPLTIELKHEIISTKENAFQIYVAGDKPAFILTTKKMNNNSDLQVIKIPEQYSDAVVIAHNLDGSPCNYIKITDNIRSLISESLLNKNCIKGELSKKFNEISQSIKNNNYETTIIMLRTFIMNDLTEIDKSKPKGGQRVIKKRIIDSLLKNYDGDVSNYVNKILNDNLSILHKYVKDEKIIGSPNPQITIYVYNNIKNFLELIESYDNCNFISESKGEK